MGATLPIMGGGQGHLLLALNLVRTRCLDPQIHKVVLHLDNGLLRCDAM